ncbi:helix-turn-helix domain-containing protein [Cohnella lubricantis]|uniref:Helix-turn-helix transcriptional regulator n=1 Tax=Cohnella lubricantis TaxID=2163172 RepID=A0A841T529_9BACL|nr:helix-turn-helix transcriptional regulator [Cohnella lubricantis]MBB6675962.1 helix-turn-helix transcriptional regulator [Cohnella lubricantis]
MESLSYGAFIKHHRLASGYKSQRRLADATGISAATISRMEDGLNRPTPETLKELSKVLDTTSYTELMVVCGYWDKDELLDPGAVTNAMKDRSPLPDGKRAVSSNDMKLLGDLKKLADEYQMDLTDPKTFDMLKDALDLIKRVRGK